MIALLKFRELRSLGTELAEVDSKILDILGVEGKEGV